MITFRRATQSIFKHLRDTSKINPPYRAFATITTTLSSPSPSPSPPITEIINDFPGKTRHSRLIRYTPPENGLTFFPQSSTISFAKTSGTYKDQVVQLIDFDKSECESVTLGGDVFDVPLRPDIVHRVVRWQLAKRRQGTHSTKTISEVSGTGRKPWQQKGTGRARHGTLRGPQFRGGATAHGPKPRSHEISLPKQIRRLGIKVSLSAKLAEGKLFFMRNLQPSSAKTKDMINFVNRFGEKNAKKILFVDSGNSVNAYLSRSTSNIPGVNTLPVVGLNVYSLLQHETVIMSLGSVREIEARLRKPINRSPSYPSEVVLHPEIVKELKEEGRKSLVGNVLTLE